MSGGHDRFPDGGNDAAHTTRGPVAYSRGSPTGPGDRACLRCHRAARRLRQECSARRPDTTSDQAQIGQEFSDPGSSEADVAVPVCFSGNPVWWTLPRQLSAVGLVLARRCRRECNGVPSTMQRPIRGHPVSGDADQPWIAVIVNLRIDSIESELAYAGYLSARSTVSRTVGSVRVVNMRSPRTHQRSLQSGER